MKKKIFIALKWCYGVLVMIIIFRILSGYTVVAHAADEDIDYQEILEKTISTAELIRGGYVDINTGITGATVLYALEHPTLTAGETDVQPVFTIPTYDMIQGKVQLQWTVGDYDGYGTLISSKTQNILLEATVISTDTPTSIASTYKDPITGITYVPNAINLSITRENGNITRYVILYNDFDFSRRRSPSANTYAISAGAASLYSYSDDTGIGGAVASNFYTQNIIFNNNPVNSITFDVNSVTDRPDLTNRTSLPAGIYSYSGNAVSSNSPLDYPVDIDICRGVFNFQYLGVDGSGLTGNKYAVGFYCNRYFYTSFVNTNDPVTGAVFNSYRTDNYNKNFYYDQTFVGGTQITNNNYNDYYNGVLAPMFSPDIDWSVPDISDLLASLVPDIELALKPQIDADMSLLKANIDNYFKFMPDIGFEWNPDLELNNNNYLELSPPDLPDDPGGGGGGGSIVTWVPPQYDPVNTSVYIPAVVPSYSTYVAATAPAHVITGGKNVFSMGYGVLDTLGLWSLVIPLAVFAILWRFTGGD